MGSTCVGGGCREAEHERATERQNILREKEAARRLLIRIQVFAYSYS